jgi:hypothetical protein
MVEVDIEKIAFHTHHGHFKSLVMLFELMNTAATFQSLMNDVLQDSTRSFVLVFFDDILIYNRSWSEHLHHVWAVLHWLRDNQLAVKNSMCSFGATAVAYLGHVISTQGVAMDTENLTL